MSNEGLPPVLGMKKETPLVIGGYSVPSYRILLQYTNHFPAISYWTPMDPFDLIQLDTESSNLKTGWYFSPQHNQLNRVRAFARGLIQHLQQNYPIYYKGSKMRWNIGSLDTNALQHDGRVRVYVEESTRYPDLFRQGLSNYVGYEVYNEYENNAIRSKERQQARAALIKPNFNEIKRTVYKYDPDRVERGVKYLMREKGLSSHNAFLEVMEHNTNLYNVSASGVGEAYGPWINGYVEPEEEVEEANNVIYNGGSNQAKPINARIKKASTVAAPTVPTQQPVAAVIPAPWHLETANQKRKRLANAASKRNTNKKRKTRKQSRKH